MEDEEDTIHFIGWLWIVGDSYICNGFQRVCILLAYAFGLLIDFALHVLDILFIVIWYRYAYCMYITNIMVLFTYKMCLNCYSQPIYIYTVYIFFVDKILFFDSSEREYSVLCIPTSTQESMMGVWHIYAILSI